MNSPAELHVPGGAVALGILGGTFNPPHLGHLALARHAREELDLQHLMVMPASSPPHKQTGEGGLGGRDPGPQHRLEMCRALFGDVPWASVCDLEIHMGGMSYTVDTLSHIRASNPDAQLTFILGADVARTLPTWHKAAELLGLAEFAVAARGGASRQELLQAIAGLGPLERITFLQMPEIEISSSEVRERAGQGEPLDDLVGCAVARYISEHRLYGAPAGVEGSS